MNAIYVLLFLGALTSFALITVLALGSLIHLARLGNEALQAIGRIFNLSPAASQSAPAARPAHPRNAVPAEIGVRGDVACAAA